MRKIIFALSLAAIMIISGCASVTPPVVSRNPVPNSEIAESLITKVKSNAATNTFEGFTGESTLGDVLANAEFDKLTNASIFNCTELVGYPVVVEYAFNDDRGDKSLLCGMILTIYPRSQESEQDSEADLLAKLDAGLGTHHNHYAAGDTPHYVWDKDGLMTDMFFYGYGNPHNGLAKMYLSVSEDTDTFPEIPAFFPHQLGTDIETVYASFTTCALPDGAIINYSFLGYYDHGIPINIFFETDETGVLRLEKGAYNIYLNGMEFNESIDYFETLADDLESAIGASNSRGYDIPFVDKYENGIPTGWGTDYGRDLCLQDILDSDNKVYCLSMTWPGVFFSADHVNGDHMEYCEWVE